MTISSLDALLAAPKQRVEIFKTSSQTGVANCYQDLIAVAGNPGAGTLAGTSTSTGVVPTDATTGVPIINAFTVGGALGYISRMEATSTVACRIAVYDLLWKAGAYAVTANTTGQSPTSFSSRVPGGTDFTGCELWAEQVTQSTGNQNIAVTYTDQGGASGTTGTVAGPASTIIVGRMWQLPLAAGDSGVQGVTGVVASTATGGTFNILVMRKLCEIGITVANQSIVFGPLETGMPQVFADSALIAVVAAASTSTGVPFVYLDIING